MSRPNGVARVGCGSGFARDRLQPAIDLAYSGQIDYLSFDCLAERTLALAHVRKRADPDSGYDGRLGAMVPQFAPAVADGLKVVGNFGVANVPAALDCVVEGFRELGSRQIRVAAIHGDDVLELIRRLNPYIPDLGCTVGELGERLVSANCYLGAEQIVAALHAGANWVLGGRISDASLFVGPICHAMGWDLHDWDRVAHATLAGHILECSSQATGGYFADPPHRVVPGLDRVGFPFAEVDDDQVVISKLESAGGMVTRHTVGLQVPYEVHDPSAYLTPDVTADFTAVTCEDVGENRVSLRGARGAPAPATSKVLIGVDTGFKAVGEISYAAAGCVERGRLAIELLDSALSDLKSEIEELRYDLHGVDALVGREYHGNYPAEVRLRAAARLRTREAAELFGQEVERLYLHGPAGGGGVTTSVVPALSIFAVYVDAAEVHPSIELVDV